MPAFYSGRLTSKLFKNCLKTEWRWLSCSLLTSIPLNLHGGIWRLEESQTFPSSEETLWITVRSCWDNMSYQILHKRVKRGQTKVKTLRNSVFRGSTFGLHYIYMCYLFYLVWHDFCKQWHEIDICLIFPPDNLGNHIIILAYSLCHILLNCSHSLGFSSERCTLFDDCGPLEGKFGP